MTDPHDDPAAADPSAGALPGLPRPDFAHANGWDRDFEAFAGLRPADLRRPDDLHEAALGHRSGRAPAPRRGRRDRRRPVRRRRQPPAGRPLRPAGDPRGAIHDRLDQLAPARHVEPFEVLTVVDAGDANIVPAWIERGHAMIYRKVREVAATGAIPIVLGGDHSITWPSAHRHRGGPPAGQHRDRPLRCPRGHGARGLGRAGRPRHADAPAHRVRRGEGQELRPGRACAATGRRPTSSSGCSQQGMRWHLMTRDRGAGRRGGHRRRDRRGARRPRRDLPLDRHRRDRPGDGPRDRDAGAGRHADPRGPPGDPPDRRGGRACRDGHRRGLAALRPRRDHGDGGQPRAPSRRSRALAVKKAAGRAVRFDADAGVASLGASTGTAHRPGVRPRRRIDA